MMKPILTTIVFIALAVTGVAQTRNVIVDTDGVVQSPTNFWSADVTNARSGLGLGTAATNPASAFQPSSVALSNLAAGNGGSLTNITATIVGTNISITNVSGLQSALDGKLATNGNTTGTASNVTGVVSLANGGTGGSNATSARISLGATTVGANIFTLSNPDEIRFLRINVNSTVSALTAADFRTAIGASSTVGTVTSVGMTVPVIFSLTPATITSNGTFALTLANQTSRQVFIAPSGGGVPAFRGVESDDLPSLAISKITGLQTALDGKLATNGTATLANNVTGIVALANGGTSGSNAATARTGLGATTVGASIFTLLNPSAITFLRLNADNTVSALSDANFRTAIGLGTAATNPATAFQPSSLILSNLSSSNGGALTNLTAANITGAIAISNGGSGATTAGGARTNFGLGNISTNTFASTQTAIFVNTNFVATNGAAIFTNLQTSYLEFGGNDGYLFVSGTGATNLVFEEPIARTNFLRGLGLSPTNGVAFGSVTTGDTVISDGSIGWNGEKIQLEERKFFGGWTFEGGAIDVAGETNKAITRTNLGLGSASSVAFSNLSVSNGVLTNPAIVLGSTSRGFYATAGPERIVTVVGGINALQVFSNSVETATGISLSVSGAGSFGTNLQVGGPLSFSGTNAAGNSGATRTNLGLGWSALTNSNAGIGLVSVNTNGQVVSPTNFWQAAPINTVVQYQTNVTGTSTNAATNARNLYLYSLAPTVSGVTNTVTLPTNSATFFGDVATVIHEGPTNSFTAVKQIGSATNIISLNQFQEAVQFIYNGDGWKLADNISYTEPIYFSGTNAALYAAASRTNLGIPLAALTNTNNADFQAAIFSTNSVPTNAANVNAVNFNTAIHWMEVNVVTNGVTNNFRIPLFK